MEDKKEKDGINISDIIRVLKKNVILMLSILGAVLIIGMLYTFVFVKPKYKSQATIFVLSSSYYAHYYDSNASDSSESIRFTLSVANIIKGDALLHPVYEKFISSNPGCKWDYQTFASRIQTTVPDDTFIIYISCVDTNAERARDIANMVADQVVAEGKSETGLLNFLNDGYVERSDSAKTGTKISPNVTTYILVTVFLGIASALIVVFIKEFASTKFKTKEEIETLGLPIVGTIHYDKRMKSDNPTMWLLDFHDSEFDYYDRLFTNIRYSSVDNPAKVIMITSTVSKELKTCVAANLASCIASDDKKVCLIDLDIRNPQLHEIYGVAFEDGLADYFENVINKTKLIKRTFENVDLITVGEDIPNPTQFLSSEKLKALVNELKETYDYILIDTPPVLEFNDALVASTVADGVLYNIAIDQTRKRDVYEGIKMLKNVNAPIVGINITKSNYQNKNSYFMRSEEEKRHPDEKILREAKILKSSPIPEPVSEKSAEDVIKEEEKKPQTINKTFNNDAEEVVEEEVIYVDEEGNEIVEDDSEYDEVEYVEEDSSKDNE